MVWFDLWFWLNFCFHLFIVLFIFFRFCFVYFLLCYFPNLNVCLSLQKATNTIFAVELIRIFWYSSWWRWGNKCVSGSRELWLHCAGYCFSRFRYPWHHCARLSGRCLPVTDFRYWWRKNEVRLGFKCFLNPSNVWFFVSCSVCIVKRPFHILKSRQFRWAFLKMDRLSSATAFENVLRNKKYKLGSWVSSTEKYFCYN